MLKRSRTTTENLPLEEEVARAYWEKYREVYNRLAWASLLNGDSDKMTPLEARLLWTGEDRQHHASPRYVKHLVVSDDTDITVPYRVSFGE